MYENFKLSNSEYIPQFAGLPLDTAERVGDELQTKHYENIARLQQLELLGLQQKANAEADADRSYIDKQISGVQSALSEIAKNGGEHATSRVAALANQYLGDEGLINIGKSIASTQRQKETLEKLGKKGVINQKAYDDWKKRGTYNSETGKWEPYVSTAQEQLDYVEKANQIFEPLRANTYQTDLVADVKTTLGSLGLDKVIPGVSGDLSKLPAQYKTEVIEALTKKRIEDFAERQGGWNSYKNSSEYAQQKDVLDMSEDQIKANFMSRGYAKIYDKVLKDWETNKLLGLIGSRVEQPPTKTPVGEQMPNSPVNVKLATGDLDDFDPRKREEMGYFSVTPGAGGESRGTVASRGKEYTGTVKNISKERWEAFKNYAKIGSEILGEAADFSNLNENSSPQDIAKAKKFADEYAKLVAERQTFNVKLTTDFKRESEEGRSNADDVTRDVRDNIANRVVFDPTTGKILPVLNKDGQSFNDDFIELLGEGGVANLHVTGELSPENYIAKKTKNEAFADPYIVTVRDPKDPAKYRELYVTRRKYDAPSGKALEHRATNKIYSELNAEPGMEKTIEIYGKKIKGKELYGKQLSDYIATLPENERELAASAKMPILATLPGQTKPVLFDGPSHLSRSILENINSFE